MVVTKLKVCISGRDRQFLWLCKCGHGNVARILLEKVNVNRRMHCKMCVFALWLNCCLLYVTACAILISLTELITVIFLNEIVHYVN